MDEPAIIEIADVAGQIDYGIITMRDNEFSAVLERFKPRWRATGERHYNIAEIISRTGRVYYAAIIRTPGQGQSEAQHAASQLINELSPTCLLLVGIAGAKPESEFSLGDVIVATRLHDFSVQAALPDGSTELSNTGGPMHALIQNAIANLEADKALLGDWGTAPEIGRVHPPVEFDAKCFLGNDDGWKQKVRASLVHRFGDPQKDRPPLATAAPLAAANILMKDPAVLKSWLEHARDLKAVEMELPGVYTAARSAKGDRPILAVRGISDVVGYARDPAWTDYACRTAASFAFAYISAGILPIVPKQNTTRRLAECPIKIVNCSIESSDEPISKFHVTLENRGLGPVSLQALRFSIVKIWDIPTDMSTGLVPWEEPDLPRVDIPPQVGGTVEVTLNENILPKNSTTLSWNLFSREAKTDNSKLNQFPYPYGLHIFHLQSAVATDAGELNLPALVVHLHGFGMIGGMAPLRISLREYGVYIDKAREVLALIEGGAVADGTLAADLAGRIEHYRSERSKQK